MKLSLRYKYFSVLVCCIVLGCQSEETTLVDVEVVQLDQYETIVSFETGELANPAILKYDGESGLIVFDAGLNKVLGLDGRGNIVAEYGSSGHGPGEFQHVNNLFLTEEYLYLFDRIGHFIHKYNRQGYYISTLEMDMYEKLYMPMPPPLPSDLVSAMDDGHGAELNSQPYITSQGYVLRPPDEPGPTVFELQDWEGNFISRIGEVPERGHFELDMDDYKTAVSNREVPAIFQSYAFPVTNKSASDELFVVYSAASIIAKYNTAGERLWQADIPLFPELRSVANHYYETMEQVLDITEAVSLFRKYTTGVSDENGNLYLITNRDQNHRLWVHKFSAHGELVRRYELTPEVEFKPDVFDIDFLGRRMFLVTEEAEIRAYSF